MTVTPAALQFAEADLLVGVAVDLLEAALNQLADGRELRSVEGI